MPASQEQKVDFLLKKIGYSASKTGIAEDSNLTGSTKKAPFAEAIPSPLVIPKSSIWSDSGFIPTTPPTSNTTYVGIYTAANAYRMTYDNTVGAARRSFIARSTYGNQTASIDGDWVDTQFGADYIVKVYKNNPGIGTEGEDYFNLQQAGNAGDDGWFFDYSSGVLNFNGDSLPSGIGTDNVYLVGYRYTGAKGVQPPAGIGTFRDLVVSNNFKVGGISTFSGLIDANGLIEGIAGQNKIPSLYANYSDLPNPGTYHGMFAHVHATGRGYYAHAGNWMELVNKEVNGTVGTGTERYDIGPVDSTSLKVTGITTLGSIGISTGLITGPAVTYIDPATVGDDTGTLVVKGNLQVDGTQTTVNSSTMTVTDKNIELAIGAANDAAADGGGITVKSGDGDKTWQWVDATDSWTSSEHIRIPDEKKATFGDSSDLQIYHTPSDNHNSFIKHTGAGALKIAADHFRFRNAADNSNILNGLSGGAVALYFAGNEKLKTTSVGIEIPDTISHLNDANTKIRFPSDDNITFETAGTERVRIDSNGQLLVGTTSPGANVRAVFQGYNGGGENFQARVQFQTNQATNLTAQSHLANLLFTNASSSLGARIDVKADANWGTGSYPSRIEFGTTPSGANTPSERLRIDSDGDVIIGTSSWQYKKALNVQGSSGSILSLYNADTTTYAADTNSSIELRLLTGNTGNQFGSCEIRAFKENGTNGNNARALSFYTGVNGGTPNERLRIKSTGQVAIGTTVEGQVSADELTLSGSGTVGMTIRSTDSVESNIFMSDATTGSGEYAGWIKFKHNTTPNRWEFGAVNTQIFNILADGKVGINSDAPPTTFDVNGTSQFQDDVTFTTANSKNIVFDKSANDLTFGDNTIARFGDSNDLSIYHDSTSSNILDAYGGLNIRSNVLSLKNGASNSKYLEALNGSHVKLYFAGNEKLATSGVGVTVTGLTDTDTLTTGNATFTGTVSAGSTTGTDGYYLKSVGTGVTWAAFPSSRTGLTTTATAGQTSFNFSYNVGFVDVFVNGVKLPSSEFTASNGSTIVLDDAAFANDTLEFISLNTLPVTSAENLTNLQDVTITSPKYGQTLRYNGVKFVNDFHPHATTTSTSQVSITNLPIASYRSAEYLIQVTEGTKYHVTKIIAIHDGTNVTFNEYGTITTHSSLATFTLDINSGIMRLLATPASTNSTTFKVKFDAITV